MGEEFDDVQTGLATALYYLYRLAGCPLGDSLSGFNAWIELQRDEFSKFSDRCDDE